MEKKGWPKVRIEMERLKSKEGKELSFRAVDLSLDPDRVIGVCDTCVSGRKNLGSCSQFNGWGRAWMNQLDVAVNLRTLDPGNRIRPNCGLPEAIERQLPENSTVRQKIEEAKEEGWKRQAVRALRGRTMGLEEAWKFVNDYTARMRDQDREEARRRRRTNK